MNRKTVKIGYAPTRRNVFSAEAALVQRKLVLKKIKTLTDCILVDIDDINNEGLLYSENDLPAIIKRFKDEEVDGIFCPHCNFGSEDLVSKLAKAVGKPLLVWGPRDEAPFADGTRDRDSQCGLFATGKVLRRFGVPYTYLPNDTMNSLSFTRGYQGFVAVCGCVGAFYNTRILQIAPRPADFWTMIVNEGELLEKFGVQIKPVPMTELTHQVKELISAPTKELDDATAHLKASLDCSKMPQAAVTAVAALYLSVMQLLKESGCSSVCIQCWTDLQKEIGIMPCLVNGLLCEQFIPMTCETDLHGAISSVLLQQAALCTTPVFFADLTVRHPTNDNAELLWHCGNFPQKLAKPGCKKEMSQHFVFPTHCPGTGNWELRGGDLTVCRFDGDNGKYSLFIGEGKSCEGPFTQGTYVWLETKDWACWEKKLVEGPYVHHCAGIHAHVAPILWETCKYIPHLNADLADENESEMMQWWMGR